MRNQTNLGMSLGKMLAGAFGGNSEAELKGKLDGAHALYYQSGADFNRAKTAESEADTSIKNRQLNLDPGEIASGQLGIPLDLGEQLRKFHMTGDYGNGSMDVPNNLSTGERNLANSYRTEFIKPEGWDDEKAKRYGQAYSAINYALSMGEKNPESYVKAINESNKGDFQRGDISQDIIDRARREAAISGKVLDVQKAGHLGQIADGGLDPQKFNSLVQSLTLGNGDSMFSFGQDYIGNNVTGGQTLNPIGAGEVELKKAQTANQRSNMAVDQARIRDLNASANTRALKNNDVQDKPLPVGALKLQDEHLEAIGSVSGINADMNSFVKQIDSGSLNLGFLANALSGAKNFAGMSDEQSRNLQSFKSTLEKMRNASLSLNKGVQTDGDAQRSWNELVTNINDPKVVRQRLIEIQALNARAAKLKMAKNNVLRRNYGAQEMDYTPYLYQDTAIDSRPTGQPTVSQPVNKLPSGAKQIGTSKGKPVYQTPDGKKFIGD